MKLMKLSFISLLFNMVANSSSSKPILATISYSTAIEHSQCDKSFVGQCYSKKIKCIEITSWLSHVILLFVL